MTNWLISSITVLVHVACQIFFSRSQTITVNPVGIWTEGSSVTLTCTISSYSGEMKWKLGSTDVAKCSLITCSTLVTGEGTYLFGLDSTNRIFTWTINQVKLANNGKVFSCSNGTNTANFTASVQRKPTPGPTIEYNLSLYSTITVSIVIIGFIIGVIFFCKRHKDQEVKQADLEGLLLYQCNERLIAFENMERRKPRKKNKDTEDEMEDTNPDNIRAPRPLPPINK